MKKKIKGEVLAKELAKELTKRPHPLPLRVTLLKKIAHKKYKCVVCLKELYKYQMYICPTCNQPTFCKTCLKTIDYYTCKTTIK